MRHCGVEQVITAGGKRYRLSRLTRAVVREWLYWADSQVPDAVSLAARHLDSVPCPDILVDVADDIASHRYTFDDSPVALLEFTQEGQYQFFHLLCQRYHWQASDAELWGVWQDIAQDWPRIVQRASGVVPVDPTESLRKALSDAGLLPYSGPAVRNSTTWAEIDRSIFANCYLTPAQVDEMTLPEIQVVLSVKKEDQVVGTSIFTALRNSPARLYLRLTARQKLALAAQKSN